MPHDVLRSHDASRVIAVQLPKPWYVVGRNYGTIIFSLIQ